MMDNSRFNNSRDILMKNKKKTKKKKLKKKNPFHFIMEWIHSIGNQNE